MASKFKRRVLSIDGGGIRGIIPAMVLKYIEEKMHYAKFSSRAMISN